MVRKLSVPIKTENECDLARLTARAEQGDESVMPALRARFDAEPGLWRQVGNLARLTELAILRNAFGKDLYAREAIQRQARAMRAELGGDQPSPLERLLVDRIVLCWLSAHYAEIIYAQNMKELSLAGTESHQKRIDRAHRRYLGAITALAQVRRLQLPTMQVNIAEQQVNVASG